jgi:hypothetical protein
MATTATSEIQFERGLPASIDAERSILGAVLLDNHAYNEAAERLTQDDFALDQHRRIYARMAELIDAGRAVDIVTLAEELAKRKEVEAVGGRIYRGGFRLKSTSGSSRTSRCCGRSSVSARRRSRGRPTSRKRRWKC